ncbi:hypothetical protein I308_100946 [Cryptococcus tetragattii IND107]|uniref:Uncharacterized protein n=1 Tax=Cryptococcus tetragattii IND107 TaxID=1296105 RepID=A0ABR3BYV3_9TREE
MLKSSPSLAQGSSLISYFIYISFFVSYFERSILGTILEAERTCSSRREIIHNIACIFTCLDAEKQLNWLVHFSYPPNKPKPSQKHLLSS